MNPSSATLEFYFEEIKEIRWKNRILQGDQSGRYSLKPGETFQQLANLNLRAVHMFCGVQLMSFYVYDPDVDGSHHKIYYQVDSLGAWRGYDNKDFQRVKLWQ